MRIPGRPSGEATVLELFAWALVLSLFFPLVAVLLVLRYRVIQAIIAGYREGGRSGLHTAERSSPPTSVRP